MSGSDALLTFNGINGSTGRYDVEPMAAEDFSRIVLGTGPARPDEKAHLEELERRRKRDTQAHYAPKEGIDPKKLEQTGWGVIFAFGADPAVY